MVEPMPFLEQEKVEKFRELLQHTQQIAIAVHVNPDGDAVGTSLALAHCLKAIGKEVSVIAPNPFPDFLLWLDGAKDILIYKHEHAQVKKVLSTTDLVICADFNSLSRLDDLGKIIAESAIPCVLIDHHLKPAEEEFEICFSKVKACSSAEVLYNLIKQIGFLPHLSATAAESVYAGMMTDTNNFLNNCDRPEMFRTVAELLELGVNKEKVHEAVYNNYSESRMRLLGYALEQKMVVLPEYRTAYIVLSRKELEQFNFQAGDTEGFVNFPLSIKNIVFSGFISENPDNVRLSFRSRGTFSVNDFARNHFEGGGHLNAAGGNSTMSLDDTVTYFVESLKKYKDELDLV